MWCGCMLLCFIPESHGDAVVVVLTHVALTIALLCPFGSFRYHSWLRGGLLVSALGKFGFEISLQRCWGLGVAVDASRGCAQAAAPAAAPAEAVRQPHPQAGAKLLYCGGRGPQRQPAGNFRNPASRIINAGRPPLAGCCRVGVVEGPHQTFDFAPAVV
jgi:hypothetical protein